MAKKHRALEGAVALLVEGDKVWLARKTRSLGRGKWNGYGGKRKRTETLLECFHRELTKESGGVVADSGSVEKVARVTFWNGMKICDCFIVHFFIVRSWRGTPKATSEMATPRRFSITKLPVRKMLPGDSEIFRKIVKGEIFVGDVYFDKDMENVISATFYPTVKNHF